MATFTAACGGSDQGEGHRTGGSAGVGGHAGEAGQSGGASAGASGQAGTAGNGGSSGGTATCTPGEHQACYSGPAGTENVGVCRAGTSTCTPNSNWGPCESEVVPGPEDCTTQQDENCDGETPPCSTSLADLRADVNRDGLVDLADPDEDEGEEAWSASRGATFLANIDDDDGSCPTTGSDEELAACHDASNEEVDGPDDALDLARLATVPLPASMTDASGSLGLNASAADYVRLFKKTGSGFELYPPGALLGSDELLAGVQFGIEALDIVRDDAIWDGFVTVTLTVDPGQGPALTDEVELRVAPVLFRHHLDPPQTVYATSFLHLDQLAFRDDLSAAMTASGLTEPLALFTGIPDHWTQDFFETAYMAMPAPGGKQVIHVNFRSPNFIEGALRPAGEVVFTQLRGPDVAGAVQYDPSHDDTKDTLNSFGNFETIPPLPGHPAGRVIVGSSPAHHPDASLMRMVRAQGMDSSNTLGIQDPVEVDTSFLRVGHIDETISFTSSTQGNLGWRVLIADTRAGWNLLSDACETPSDPGCSTIMFEGTLWETTLGDVVGSSDFLADNAWAVVEIDSQQEQLKQAIGITDDDFTSLPAVWTSNDGRLVAYVPAVVNGISLGPHDFGAPKTYGPMIGGTDPFVVATTHALEAIGVTAHWIEDWEWYHQFGGEVHCGSNVTRQIPTTWAWWEVQP